MTQQFENFVNAALDKSLASDVTLPTANEIPVFTGIGRQVTGKTIAELGLATSSQLTGKADLVDGLVPAIQLPGYVDDVLEYANLASFPLLGEASKLYIAINTNLVYRWSGSTYAVTSSSLALGEISTTAYRGDRGKTAYDHSQATGNPHNLPAASTGADGYLTSTDWNTFNGKQAALGNVITANTYGSSTQYPIVTVNAKGIVTNVTLQTVPTPTFTDATFAVQKNVSPSISATWSLTAFTGSHVHTYPDKDINFGNMSFIATTDFNTLSGTRNRIVGGSHNTVSGTDNIVIGSDNLNISSSQAGLNARGMRHKVRGSTAITLPTGSLIDGMQSGIIDTSTFAGGCKITSYFKIDKEAAIQNAIVADSSGIKPLANIGKDEFYTQSVAAHKLTITSSFATQAAEWLIVVRESELPVVLAKGGIGSHLPTITATASSTGSGDSILRELTITIASTAGTIANGIRWNVFLESYYTATEPSA